MSVLEIGHRTSAIADLAQTLESELRELLAIPPEFAVLLMSGGARLQFAAVPLNLLRSATEADYVVTGHWSWLAQEEAKRYCTPRCHISNAPHYTHLPQWESSPHAPYCHYADNETIHGVEFLEPPPFQGIYFVSDMTSSITTKPLPFSQLGMVYASAQKHLGIAGVTLVIVRREWLGQAHAFVPSVMDYTLFEASRSLYNTPAVFCWYVLGLMVRWALEEGGVSTLSRRAHTRAQRVYDIIDRSDFYCNSVEKPCRSRLNIPFRLPSVALEALFLKEANAQGFYGLKGHALVGGMRASLYNAMPERGAEDLADFMKHFEKTHG